MSEEGGEGCCTFDFKTKEYTVVVEVDDAEIVGDVTSSTRSVRSLLELKITLADDESISSWFGETDVTSVNMVWPVSSPNRS